MNFVFKKNMFNVKKLGKGGLKNSQGKFLYWVNLWGFGIIVTNTFKGLKYDITVCNTL